MTEISKRSKDTREGTMKKSIPLLVLSVLWGCSHKKGEAPKPDETNELSQFAPRLDLGPNDSDVVAKMLEQRKISCPAPDQIVEYVEDGVPVLWEPEVESPMRKFVEEVNKLLTKDGTKQVTLLDKVMYSGNIEITRAAAILQLTNDYGEWDGTSPGTSKRCFYPEIYATSARLMLDLSRIPFSTRNESDLGAGEFENPSKTFYGNNRVLSAPTSHYALLNSAVRNADVAVKLAELATVEDLDFVWMRKTIDQNKKVGVPLLDLALPTSLEFSKDTATVRRDKVRTYAKALSALAHWERARLRFSHVVVPEHLDIVALPPVVNMQPGSVDTTVREIISYDLEESERLARDVTTSPYCAGANSTDGALQDVCSEVNELTRPVAISSNNNLLNSSRLTLTLSDLWCSSEMGADENQVGKALPAKFVQFCKSMRENQPGLMGKYRNVHGVSMVETKNSMLNMAEIQMDLERMGSEAQSYVKKFEDEVKSNTVYAMGSSGNKREELAKQLDALKYDEEGLKSTVLASEKRADASKKQWEAGRYSQMSTTLDKEAALTSANIQFTDLVSEIIRENLLEKTIIRAEYRNKSSQDALNSYYAATQDYEKSSIDSMKALHQAAKFEWSTQCSQAIEKGARIQKMLEVTECSPKDLSQIPNLVAKDPNGKLVRNKYCDFNDSMFAMSVVTYEKCPWYDSRCGKKNDTKKFKIQFLESDSAVDAGYHSKEYKGKLLDRGPDVEKTVALKQPGSFLFDHAKRKTLDFCKHPIRIFRGTQVEHDFLDIFISAESSSDDHEASAMSSHCKEETNEPNSNEYQRITFEYNGKEFPPPNDAGKKRTEYMESAWSNAMNCNYKKYLDDVTAVVNKSPSESCKSAILERAQQQLLEYEAAKAKQAVNLEMGGYLYLDKKESKYEKMGPAQSEKGFWGRLSHALWNRSADAQEGTTPAAEGTPGSGDGSPKPGAQPSAGTTNGLPSGGGGGGAINTNRADKDSPLTEILSRRSLIDNIHKDATALQIEATKRLAGIKIDEANKNYGVSQLHLEIADTKAKFMLTDDAQWDAIVRSLDTADFKNRVGEHCAKLVNVKSYVDIPDKPQMTAPTVCTGTPQPTAAPTAAAQHAAPNGDFPLEGAPSVQWAQTIGQLVEKNYGLASTRFQLNFGSCTTMEELKEKYNNLVQEKSVLSASIANHAKAISLNDITLSQLKNQINALNLQPGNQVDVSRIAQGLKDSFFNPAESNGVKAFQARESAAKATSDALELSYQAAQYDLAAQKAYLEKTVRNRSFLEGKIRQYNSDVNGNLYLFGFEGFGDQKIGRWNQDFIQTLKGFHRAERELAMAINNLSLAKAGLTNGAIDNFIKQMDKCRYVSNWTTLRDCAENIVAEFKRSVSVTINNTSVTLSIKKWDLSLEPTSANYQTGRFATIKSADGTLVSIPLYKETCAQRAARLKDSCAVLDESFLSGQSPESKCGPTDVQDFIPNEVGEAGTVEDLLTGNSYNASAFLEPVTNATDNRVTYDEVVANRGKIPVSARISVSRACYTYAKWVELVKTGKFTISLAEMGKALHLADFEGGGRIEDDIALLGKQFLGANANLRIQQHPYFGAVDTNGKALGRLKGEIAPDDFTHGRNLFYGTVSSTGDEICDDNYRRKLTKKLVSERWSKFPFVPFSSAVYWNMLCRKDYSNGPNTLGELKEGFAPQPVAQPAPQTSMREKSRLEVISDEKIWHFVDTTWVSTQAAVDNRKKAINPNTMKIGHESYSGISDTRFYGRWFGLPTSLNATVGNDLRGIPGEKHPCLVVNSSCASLLSRMDINKILGYPFAGHFTFGYKALNVNNENISPSYISGVDLELYFTE